MDEVRTHAEVLAFLPKGIADELERAMPPEQRGWWTAEEAADYDGELIEIIELGDPVPRFLRGGDPKPRPIRRL